MKTWVRRSVRIGVIAAGFLLFGATAANASTMSTTGNTGLLNGTQAVIPVQVPVEVSGNAVSVGGYAQAGSKGGSAARITESGHGKKMISNGNHGALNGTQLVVPVQIPVNVCGNAVSVAGFAGAGCKGGSNAKIESAGKGGPSKMISTNNHGLLNGTQAVIPVQIPINVCGNAVAIAGHAVAGCKGGSSAKLAEGAVPSHMVSAGNHGVANGTQAVVPVQIPINVCGNAIGILGTAEASCKGGADANNGGGGGHHHDDDCDDDGHGHGKGAKMISTDNSGALNGTQAVVPVQVPVDVSGNAVGVAGAAAAHSKGGSKASIK